MAIVVNIKDKEKPMSRREFLVECQLKHGWTAEQASRRWRAVESATRAQLNFGEMTSDEMWEYLNDYAKVEALI